MQTIIVKENQTLFDLAVQHYGAAEAVVEILQNNPAIRNDKNALVALGVDYLTDTNFYVDAAVEAGFVLQIDTDSKLLNLSITREIGDDVTTFNL